MERQGIAKACPSLPLVPDMQWDFLSSATAGRVVLVQVLVNKVAKVKILVSKVLTIGRSRSMQRYLLLSG